MYSSGEKSVLPLPILGEDEPVDKQWLLAKSVIVTLGLPQKILETQMRKRE
jgi:hypothetical protein